jgi:N-formylglutamate amidohydrolase
MPLILRFFLFAILISLPAHAWAEQDQESTRWLTVWAGMLPIILTVPHGGRTAVPGIAMRRGLGVPQFTTERDSNTAELAELVGAKVEALLGARPFLVVAHFERKFIDVNRAESGLLSPLRLNRITTLIIAQLKRLRAAYANAGAVGFCSTSTGKERKQIRSFAAPTMAEVSRHCAGASAWRR